MILGTVRQAGTHTHTHTHTHTENITGGVNIRFLAFVIKLRKTGGCSKNEKFTGQYPESIR